MIDTSLSIKTVRFGEIEFSELDVVNFRDGLVGLDALKRFLILNVKGGSPFRWLQSLDEPTFAMLVVSPRTYQATYDPPITEEDLQNLGLGSNDSAIVYVTAAIPPGSPTDMTLNLSGPIVINPANQEARQIVLSDETYNVKQRVFPQEESVGQKAA